MTVAQMIEYLRALPPNAEAGIVYDGCHRMDVGLVYLANSGWVLVAGYEQPVYDDPDRPVGAVSEKEDRYFYTPRRVGSRPPHPFDNRFGE